MRPTDVNIKDETPEGCKPRGTEQRLRDRIAELEAAIRKHHDILVDSRTHLYQCDIELYAVIEQEPTDEPT